MNSRALIPLNMGKVKFLTPVNIKHLRHFLIRARKNVYGEERLYSTTSGNFKMDRDIECRETILPTNIKHEERKQALVGLQHHEYQQRRLRLMNTIARICKERQSENALVVIPSATKLYMSEKIPYIFHQNTDFLYTTGCKECDSVLLLASAPNRPLPFHTSTMFLQKNDPHTVLWDGPRMGVETAADVLGVDEALHVDQLVHFLELFSKNKRNIIMWYNPATPANPKIHQILSTFLEISTNIHIESPQLLLQNLRLIKSPAEVELMKKSCEIASESFIEVMHMGTPGISEHVLHARMEYECKIRGADYLAYPPVVAGGKRANIIHYINNDHCIAKDEMVLMDAGCYYQGYASDITRTWPISGQFSSAQKILYEILLDVQKTLIERCLPKTSLNSLFALSCVMSGKYLKEIGILRSSVSSDKLHQAAQEFCPHHIGHYLGMDVHDSNLISRNIPLQEGMIITIEPGIYINENDNVYEEFRGLGLRIEDNILITNAKPINLTRNCPKELCDIEKIVSQSKGF